MKVSIIIKALNEEDKIAGAIESALKAIEDLNGEVILADSLSTDKTVEIASNYNIKIVQLSNPSDRRCGVGPQLGYQYSSGEYVYILDSDMELSKEFISTGIEFLSKNSSVAGVGGEIVEMSDSSFQFRRRQKELKRSDDVYFVEALEMGGLYKRAAIESVGYFSDCNLHSFEEKELGMRLVSQGWKMARLPLTSIKHYGHEVGSLPLLKKRWQSKYLNGVGEVIRACFGKPYLVKYLLLQKHIMIVYALLFIFVLSVVSLSMAVVGAVLLLGLLGVLTVKKASFKDALLSITIWTVTAVAAVRGFFMTRKNPKEFIPSRVL